MIVVKVGGSLYDHPRLGPGLRAYLDSLALEEVLVVPGGGPFAEAVRTFDRLHHIGEEAAHWLAIHSMDLAAEFLRSFDLGPRVRILNSFEFLREDDSQPGALPHSWDVTSDSIAVRAAIVHRATRLVILKSVDVAPGTAIEEADAREWVDSHFRRVVADATFPIELVNFRRMLDSWSR